MGSEFETRLTSLSAEQWEELNRWRPGATWESAWEAVLAAGGEELAVPVMQRAQYSGAPLRARALAGAAAAALSLESSLAPVAVDELYQPFAALLPRDPAPLARPATRRPRLPGCHVLGRRAPVGAGRN
jgi:hypothetical protein